MKKENNNKTNLHPYREAWLDAAAKELRDYFNKNGYMLPKNIRFGIGFTSGGKRGLEGECWHPPSSDDQSYEIIIKVDRSDPLAVLGILCHQLVHSLLPPDAKHNKQFRDIALKIGLTEGKTSHAMPGKILQDRLKKLVEEELGPYPHASLHFSTASDRPRKSGTRMLKVECGAIGCGYNMRVIPKWAMAALPICPMNPKHGLMRCDIPDDDTDDDNASSNNTPDSNDNDALKSGDNNSSQDDDVAENHHEETLSPP